MTEHNKQDVTGTPSNDADLILAPTVAEMMGLAYGSFRSYRCNGDYPTPPPLFKKAKSYFWSRSAVEVWLAARSKRG